MLPDLTGTPETGFFTIRLDSLLGWARKYSVFPYPFVTACGGMEYMATVSAHYDIDRFGAVFVRFSPRQADLLLVTGALLHNSSHVADFGLCM